MLATVTAAFAALSRSTLPLVVSALTVSTPDRLKAVVEPMPVSASRLTESAVMCGPAPHP